ncbi:MAG: pyridoxal phosphate-dependent aminotransferase [Clostridia bacterium]|nr:pyridoxal phosphate-dependent aminotransferase [Clostridia bacterium]
MRELREKSCKKREIFKYSNTRKAAICAEHVFDFSLGNPSIPAPKVFTDKLLSLIESMSPEALHGYTSGPGDMEVRKKISDYMNKKYGINSVPELIYMTCGAAASLTVSLTALVKEGDEVITLAPFFPEYTVFVEKTGAKLKPVMVRTSDFQLDTEAFRASVNENTKAVIINSPNNPTGAVLNEESVKALASVLKEKEEEFGHPIYILSDEPYRELVYDTEAPFIMNYYDDTVVLYSFSKSLSVPGERIGYIMVSPKIKEAKDLFFAVCGAGRALGYVCAPALFQYAVSDCLGVTSDISVYKKNRDLLTSALTEYGYEVVKPDGAFYLFVKALEDDAEQFCETAKKYELLLVPSNSFGCTGFVRISYCVSTEQIEKSLPSFRKLKEEYDGR